MCVHTVGREGDLCAGPLHGAHGRAQVARPVVEHGDVGLGHRAPLVDGTPVSRGSKAVASRKARANALNWVSTMWFGSRPASPPPCRARWGGTEIRSEERRVGKARASTCE